MHGERVTLVEPAIADDEGIEAHAVFPLGHDLRVRWHFDEPCPRRRTGGY